MSQADRPGELLGPRDFEPIPVSDYLSRREWDELVDIIVERIERRVVDELSRRGRRFTPEVF